MNVIDMAAGREIPSTYFSTPLFVSKMICTDNHYNVLKTMLPNAFDVKIDLFIFLIPCLFKQDTFVHVRKQKKRIRRRRKGARNH